MSESESDFLSATEAPGELTTKTGGGAVFCFSCPTEIFERTTSTAALPLTGSLFLFAGPGVDVTTRPSAVPVVSVNSDALMSYESRQLSVGTSEPNLSKSSAYIQV